MLGDFNAKLGLVFVRWNGDGDDLVTRLSAEPTTEINNFADDFSDLGVGICEFTIARNIQQNIYIKSVLITIS